MPADQELKCRVREGCSDAVAEYYKRYATRVMDGKVVDVNRIPPLADTMIIDDRFQDGMQN